MKFTCGNKTEYDFSEYKTFTELFRESYYRNMSINQAERKQDEFNVILDALSIYPAKRENILRQEMSFYIMQKILQGERKKIIEGFKNEIFPLIKEDFHSEGKRPDSSATSDLSIYESHDWTDKELKMIKTLFSYKNPKELDQDLMRTDAEEKHNEFLNDLDIKQTVLRDPIRKIMMFDAQD